MVRMIIQIAINAIALWVAAWIAPGATITDSVFWLLVLGLIFGVLNSLVRPILAFFTCPFYILTLGLFTFVMNVFILWLTEWVSQVFGTGLVNWGDFWSTMLAGIIVTVVSMLLNLFMGGGEPSKN
jgi:putative membrane protein